MASKTSLKVYPGTRDRLRAEKEGKETYDDVINRLLDSSEGRSDG